jgi:CRP/FNR family transcriptional regulator, cyclic AMP receptor protein
MQGDPCDDVLCIRTGGVALSARSKTGREAAVAMLGPGDFFGEGCLTGLPTRTCTATAITPSVIASVAKEKMARLLHSQHSMSDRFISHMLSRNTRMEDDLVDQVLNSSEQRLAGALLQLVGYGQRAKPARIAPAVSSETLADMVGISPACVNGFLAKFRKLGFIDYHGDVPLRINRTLVSVVLQS